MIKCKWNTWLTVFKFNKCKFMQISNSHAEPNSFSQPSYLIFKFFIWSTDLWYVRNPRSFSLNNTVFLSFWKKIKKKSRFKWKTYIATFLYMTIFFLCATGFAKSIGPGQPGHQYNQRPGSILLAAQLNISMLISLKVTMQWSKLKPGLVHYKTLACTALTELLSYT